jgi:cytoskeleton protein RodZ
MESIGSRFSQARESRGYTLEQVARDTHIAKRFLDALEKEEFSVFPGEPYLIGFMRTYATYLGLDSEETVMLYHNHRLQEQPPPTDELISRGSSLSFGRILLIAIVILAIGAGVYVAITQGLFDGTARAARADARAEARTSTRAAANRAAGEVFEMVDEIVEQRFSPGDRIIVPVGNQKFSVELVNVDNGVMLNSGGVERHIRVGEEILLDVNNDAEDDLRIAVRSANATGNPATVVMRLDRGAAVAASARPAIEVPVGEAIQAPSIGSTLVSTREESVRLIAGYDRREEFAVDVQFEGFALFRYEADSQARVERYYQPGETLRMNVRDRLQIWISNAGSARLRVAGQDVSLGEPGVVTASLITWVPDPQSGRVLLELIPVY